MNTNTPGLIRPIDNGDIEAAARGLNMRSLSLSDAELRGLVYRHAPQVTMFASQVIASAARRVLEERGL
jgi:hypothetical protein